MKNKGLLALYIKIVLVVSYIAISFGFVMPYLLSHKSTELPIIGAIYAISVPIVLYWSIKSVLTNKKSENEKK